MSAPAKAEEEDHTVYKGVNGMPMHNNKTHHMDCAHGDIANRVITVGAVQRAEKIAALFDTKTKVISSNRGFTTITGTYKGVAISIVAIGMGPAMMDFFVRETRAVTDGPMAIVRFGTCGGLATDSLPGTIAVATEGSGYVNRNPDAFGKTPKDVAPYTFFDVAPSCPDLSALVAQKLHSGLGTMTTVVEGVNVTAESFYSSQGRVDSSNFDDRNEDLVDLVVQHYPNAKSMEMETFMLLHLANCSKIPIYASAAAIVLANRKSAAVVTTEMVDHMELEGGRAILDALVEYKL